MPVCGPSFFVILVSSLLLRGLLALDSTAVATNCHSNYCSATIHHNRPDCTWHLSIAPSIAATGMLHFVQSSAIATRILYLSTYP